MYLTGSIGSCVGPAVTSTWRPVRGFGPKNPSIAARIASTSGRRPGPNSPQAIAPTSGAITATPRACKVATLARVAACSHIRTFIAGAQSTGLSVASNSVVARSLARPPAMRAIRSAVAGQTTTRSAARLSWICPISASRVRSNRAVCTGFSDSAASVIAVTKCAPASVSTQVTTAPALRNPRTSSQALYAAMPPPTIRRIRLPCIARA